MPRTNRLLLAAAWLAAAASTGCALQRTVTVTSEPAGARAWLGHTPVGHTPLEVAVPVTGLLDHYTFEPTYLTLRRAGHRDEVRPFQYETSWRNVLASIPTLVGYLYWGRQPVDMHVRMEPAE